MIDYLRKSRNKTFLRFSQEETQTKQLHPLEVENRGSESKIFSQYTNS